MMDLTWYNTLSKPIFTPPAWVFGPAWTILYLLMGIAFYLIWQKGKISKLFLAQLTANFLWSFLFFGLHSPTLALIDIAILLALILLTMREFYSLSKPAFYLLIPYLLWVSFATLLNGAIVFLNGF